MTSGAGAGASGSAAFLQHLSRYPEDLRDIRRLRRRYRLSILEVTRALARIPAPERRAQNRDGGPSPAP